MNGLDVSTEPRLNVVSFDSVNALLIALGKRENRLDAVDVAILFGDDADAGLLVSEVSRLSDAGLSRTLQRWRIPFLHGAVVVGVISSLLTTAEQLRRDLLSSPATVSMP